MAPVAVVTSRLAFWMKSVLAPVAATLEQNDVETRISFLLTDETIDLTVDSRVRDKAELLGEMMNDMDLATLALPDDEDYGPPIDSDLDVEALPWTAVALRGPGARAVVSGNSGGKKTS